MPMEESTPRTNKRTYKPEVKLNSHGKRSRRQKRHKPPLQSPSSGKQTLDGSRAGSRGSEQRRESRSSLRLTKKKLFSTVVVTHHAHTSDICLQELQGRSQRVIRPPAFPPPVPFFPGMDQQLHFFAPIKAQHTSTRHTRTREPDRSTDRPSAPIEQSPNLARSPFHVGVVVLPSVDLGPEHNLHVHDHVHVHGAIPVRPVLGVRPRPEGRDVFLPFVRK